MNIHLTINLKAIRATNGLQTYDNDHMSKENRKQQLLLFKWLKQNKQEL